MNERELEQLMQQDLSEGTQAFRDKLLQDCLSVLRTKEDYRVLDDSEIDMLAAAGSIATQSIRDDRPES